MTQAAVARTYANDRGLELHLNWTLPCASPTLPGLHCADAIIGPIAGGREGILYQCTGGRAIGPPVAQFAIPGLREVIDGLWVRRSGRSIWTRVKVPTGYTELTLPDDTFTGSYRVAIDSPRCEESARRLLDRDFTEWHLKHGPQGNALSQAGSFEISGGALFIRGEERSFNTAEKLDAFAVAVAALAARVGAFVDEA